jgi:hypothetical protein
VGVNRPHLALLFGPPHFGALSACAPTVTYHPGQSVTYLSGSYPAAVVAELDLAAAMYALGNGPSVQNP